MRAGGPAGQKKKRGRQPRNGKGRKPKRGLTTGALSGPPAHAEAKKVAAEAIARAKRKRTAYELFIGEGRGLTFREIGEKLGVSGKTAHGDVMDYFEELKERALFGDVEVLRQRQADTVDGVIAAHWKQRKKTRNAEVILAALQRESRLLGLDLQRKDTFTSEQVFALVRGITALFTEIVQDPEQRRQFSLGLRRKVGGALPQAGAVVSEQAQPQGKAK